ncbi:MAG: hypothetical protein CL911_03405 [Deltaproteobacteria bacterium]|nr:hypothetical protein [Deltaproteobacteria bacterium]
MRFPVHALAGCLILVLGACATEPAQPPQPPPEQPEREELVRRVPEVEPEWAVQGAHPDDEEFLYFVGYSGKHAEERNAVAEARQAAGNEFVEYCGVESRTFSKFLSVTSGRSSEVKDATESGISGSKQQSQAYFRKLRVVGRSASEFRVLRGTQEQSRFWRMKVLVKVPRSEYDAVLAWKQKREDEAKALKLAQEQQAETLLSQQLETAKASAREGNLLGALKQLQQFRETAPQQPTPKRAVFLTEADGLETRWLGSVALEADAPAEQQLEPGQTPTPLAVKASFKPGDSSIPLPNLPIRFADASGGGTVVTDAKGMATLPLPSFASEQEKHFTASPNVEWMNKQLAGIDLANLKDRKVRFRIVVRTPFLKQRIKNDFPLKLASNIEGSYQVGKTFQVFGSCAKRCRVRVYYWDGTTGIFLKGTGSRKLIKNKTTPLVPTIAPDASGNYTLIVLSTTGEFPDAVKEETTYSATEFAVVLKNFRSMKGAKAEEHLKITVQD